MKARGLPVVLLLVLALALPAAAENLFEFSQLRGIPVGGLAVRNIVGGGLPWTLTRGEAKLEADGTLKVDVEGLVLAAGPAAGTNPVAQFIATLSCLDANGIIVNVSTPVPAGADGDARLQERLTLPETCLGPLVFVQGFPNLRWFAVSGF